MLGRDGRHRGQHAHGPGRIDDRGLGLVDHSREDIGDATALAGRTVVGRDDELRRGTLHLEHAEELGLRGRTHDYIDPATSVAKLLGEHEHGRRTVATRDDDAGDALLRQDEWPPQRADDIEDIMPTALAQPLSSLAFDADDDLQGASVDAPRLHLVDGEGASQQHAALLAAHRDGDKVPGARKLRHAGSGEREH